MRNDYNLSSQRFMTEGQGYNALITENVKFRIFFFFFFFFKFHILLLPRQTAYDRAGVWLPQNPYRTKMCLLLSKFRKNILCS